MTRADFLKMMEEQGKDLMQNAIYLDDPIEHPFAINLYEEDGKWIATYEDESEMEVFFEFDTEEEAIDQIIEFIEERGEPD